MTDIITLPIQGCVPVSSLAGAADYEHSSSYAPAPEVISRDRPLSPLAATKGFSAGHLTSDTPIVRDSQSGWDPTINPVEPFLGLTLADSPEPMSDNSADPVTTLTLSPPADLNAASWSICPPARGSAGGSAGEFSPLWAPLQPHPVSAHTLSPMQHAKYRRRQGMPYPRRGVIQCAVGGCRSTFRDEYLHARHLAHTHMPQACVSMQSDCEIEAWFDALRFPVSNVTRKSAIRTFFKRKSSAEMGGLGCPRCGRGFKRRDAREKHVRRGTCGGIHPDDVELPSLGWSPTPTEVTFAPKTPSPVASLLDVSLPIAASWPFEPKVHGNNIPIESMGDMHTGPFGMFNHLGLISTVDTPAPWQHSTSEQSIFVKYTE